ncbi:hypothetical protein T310_4220 [Rasamsonia emersonii CBS 393.64]|uniref:Uncharacterized protein n=1 Tax=Rasamsonia emersonii (strain ATCC 16479 / CBS 393.64 / IMI 116815) TaxID=1408163 RepID=A0A0F4YU04_RASE3|nr:hypothetical protein T310_4220 [Rasamsonia emersonii CBS 393.64]KKA21699.1 hypothetical protein T310_4220 [Rasamsonia emersonii CBS 393.64]
MLPVSLSRQLFSTAASSTRACQSSVSRSAPASACASWEYVRRRTSLVRPPNRGSQIQNYRLVYPKNTLRRSFSTTSAAFSEPSSPFRLTSSKSSSSSSSAESPTQAPSERESKFDYEGASDEYYSPYKPKRQWPPDMSKLSPKHQFRLERKYRRRAALKYARPKWVKATKLVQWGIIGFVLIYAVLFMDWETEDHPFEELAGRISISLSNSLPR